MPSAEVDVLWFRERFRQRYEVASDHDPSCLGEKVRDLS